MQCHKCPHDAEVKAGKFKDVPHEERPCSKCVLEEESHFAMPFFDSLPRWANTNAAQGTELFLDENCQMPLWTLGAALMKMLSLKPVMRDAVSWRATGLSLADIARRQGCSPGLVDKRLKRAVKDWPELNALFLKRAVCVARRRVGAWTSSSRVMHKKADTDNKISEYQKRDQIED